MKKEQLDLYNRIIGIVDLELRKEFTRCSGFDIDPVWIDNYFRIHSKTKSISKDTILNGATDAELVEVVECFMKKDIVSMMSEY